MKTIKKGMLALTIIMASSQTMAVLPGEHDYKYRALAQFLPAAPSAVDVLVALGLITPPIVLIPTMSIAKLALPAAGLAYYKYASVKKA